MAPYEIIFMQVNVSPSLSTNVLSLQMGNDIPISIKVHIPSVPFLPPLPPAVLIHILIMN